MEQLNRIEIRGYVGNVARYGSQEKQWVRMSVGTSYAFKDRAGAAVIETTWHNVIAWPGKYITCLDRVEKGMKVQVSGRLRSQKYLGADGLERYSYDINASKLSIIEGDDPFSYEI